jgi:energy-coupling factor transporter transmembrane protein EcfT
VIAARALDEGAVASPLGRASPLLKLGVALACLVGLATTLDPRPPLVVAALVLAAGILVGRIGLRALAGGLAPLWLAALGIAVFNGLFSAANADPAAPEMFRVGPIRLTEAALAGAVGIGARVLAIGAIGVVFGLTTDPTHLVDSLVQQGHVPERFAYAALAAYGAIPRFAADLETLRQARRIRGLRGGWHPRVLVGLLVLAIRRADRMAIAMDARGFGIGPRSRYRVVRWRVLDAAVAIGGAAMLAVALSVGRA